MGNCVNECECVWFVWCVVWYSVCVCVCVLREAGGFHVAILFFELLLNGFSYFIYILIFVCNWIYILEFLVYFMETSVPTCSIIIVF